MQGPDNFDFTNWYGKKDVQQSKNYVEITPEQQAEIDKANAAAEAARNSEALQQGLSNKQPDLDKGVSVQRFNVPSQDEIIANQGEIRPADPWIVRTFNNGVYHVKNFLKELGISIGGGALLVGKGALMSLGVLQSCSKFHFLSGSNYFKDILSTPVHFPLFTSISKIHPSSLHSPSASLKPAFPPFLSLSIIISLFTPSTESSGPVIPRSVIYPVPFFSICSSAVCTWVCVPKKTETLPSR